MGERGQKEKDDYEEKVMEQIKCSVFAKHLEQMSHETLTMLLITVLANKEFGNGTPQQEETRGVDPTTISQIILLERYIVHTYVRVYKLQKKVNFS